MLFPSSSFSLPFFYSIANSYHRWATFPCSIAIAIAKQKQTTFSAAAAVETLSSLSSFCFQLPVSRRGRRSRLKLKLKLPKLVWFSVRSFSYFSPLFFSPKVLWQTSWSSFFGRVLVGQNISFFLATLFFFLLLFVWLSHQCCVYLWCVLSRLLSIEGNFGFICCCFLQKFYFRPSTLAPSSSSSSTSSLYI